MTTPEKALRHVRSLCAIMMLGALAPEPTPAGAATRWTIDHASARIEFDVDAVGYPRMKGLFRRFEGRVSVDFEHPDRSSVALHVQSRSVDVGSSSFDDYLRSAAFFDADRYPSIDFVSKSIQRIDDHAVRVSGDLTPLGLRKPLSVDVAVTRETVGGRQRLDFLGQAQIDRLAFGMNLGFPLISREVELEISSESTVIR